MSEELKWRKVWQHQQQRLDERQTQLNIAVEALKVYESIGGEGSLATIALNQINKLKGE